jgi:3-oxoacyl-[acyl-carrier protein] reductase
MDFGIRGKIAVVLGASKGMGRACAQALGQEGCSLALMAREAPPLGEQAATLAARTGQKVVHRAGDVTRDSVRQEFLAEVVARFGQVDILVNNCGGPRPGTFFELQDPKDWAEAIERSLLQVVKWTQAVVPLMKGWGRIVNIVSTSVKQPIDGLLLSNSIRPGVIGFSKSVSRELVKRGITINSVLPGAIRTDRTLELAKGRAEREQIPLERVLEERAGEIPAGRLGEPEEVGALVAYLCSQQAAYITGTTLTIDGGLTRSLG